MPLGRWKKFPRILLLFDSCRLFQEELSSHRGSRGGFSASPTPCERLHRCLHALPVFQPPVTAQGLQGGSALKWLKMCIWQGKGSGRPPAGQVHHCTYTAPSGRTDRWPKCLQCCCASLGPLPLKHKGISLVGRFPWTKLANWVCWEVWELCFLSWEAFLQERMLSKICCLMLTPQLIQNSRTFSIDIYKSFFMLKNPVEILLLIPTYALSCNIFSFFGLLWKSWYFQFKNLVGKSAKYYLFVFLWKLWFLISRHPLPAVCFGERGWAALPAHGRAQGCLCVQPQHAAAWDPAQVHQLPCSCRGIGMFLDASTDPALGKPSSVSKQGACPPSPASPVLHLGLGELLPELWCSNLGLMGIRRCYRFNNKLLFVSADTVR